jgi:hypothetical protein
VGTYCGTELQPNGRLAYPTTGSTAEPLLRSKYWYEVGRPPLMSSRIKYKTSNNKVVIIKIKIIIIIIIITFDT